MYPIKPADENIFTFKAPPVKEGSPPVQDLHGVAVGFDSGASAFYSMWQPSEEELAALNAGHPVLIGILNNGHSIHPFEVLVAKSKTHILEYPPAE